MVYALRRTGGSNPSLSAKRRARETELTHKKNESLWALIFICTSIGHRSLLIVTYWRTNKVTDDSLFLMRPISFPGLQLVPDAAGRH